MKNLKIGTKLMGGFILTSLVVLIVGSISFYEQTELEENISYIAEQTSQGMAYGMKIGDDTNNIVGLVRTLLSNRLSAEDRQAVVAALPPLREEVAELKKKIMTLSIAPDIEDELRAFNDATVEMAKINNKIIDYSNEMVRLDMTNPYFFRDAFNRFKVEHIMSRLKVGNLVQRGIAFDGGVNPTSCQLGQWLANVNSANPQIIAIADFIRPLHNEYHETVTKIKDLMAQGDSGKEQAYRLMNEKCTPLMHQVLTKLDEGRVIAEKATDVFRQMADTSLHEGNTSVAAVKKADDALTEELATLSKKAVAQAHAAATTGKTLSIVCMVVGVALALILGFILTKSITGPVSKVIDLTRAMAAGDLTKTVNIDRKDEIGALASSCNDMAANLRQMFGDVQRGVDNVDGASGQLAAISGQMSSGSEATASLSSQVAAAAEEMSGNQNTVAAAMEQASVNVNMVATATEEMSATINEIASNSAKAKDITSEAVEQSKKASERVGELGNAADEINKVTEVITEISEQTNLLALNATIEAARAGEAGKGFAVVANEIKDLAKQTAEATLDIKNKIADIQRATGVTVKEINEIRAVIADVDSIVAAIATAVEEQSATTKEIAENVSQASSGITEVNENVAQSSTVAQEIAKDIAKVSQSAGEMRDASGQVRSNAENLKQVSDGLKTLVDQFKI